MKLKEKVFNILVLLCLGLYLCSYLKASITPIQLDSAELALSLHTASRVKILGHFKYEDRNNLFFPFIWMLIFKLTESSHPFGGIILTQALLNTIFLLFIYGSGRILFKSELYGFLLLLLVLTSIPMSLWTTWPTRHSTSLPLIGFFIYLMLKALKNPSSTKWFLWFSLVTILVTNFYPVNLLLWGIYILIPISNKRVMTKTQKAILGLVCLWFLFEYSSLGLLNIQRVHKELSLLRTISKTKLGAFQAFRRYLLAFTPMEINFKSFIALLGQGNNLILNLCFISAFLSILLFILGLIKGINHKLFNVFIIWWGSLFVILLIINLHTTRYFLLSISCFYILCALGVRYLNELFDKPIFQKFVFMMVGILLICQATVTTYAINLSRENELIYLDRYNSEFLLYPTYAFIERMLKEKYFLHEFGNERYLQLIFYQRYRNLKYKPLSQYLIFNLFKNEVYICNDSNRIKLDSKTFELPIVLYGKTLNFSVESTSEWLVINPLYKWADLDLFHKNYTLTVKNLTINKKINKCLIINLPRVKGRIIKLASRSDVLYDVFTLPTNKSRVFDFCERIV